jgi:hypothetical protein
MDQDVEPGAWIARHGVIHVIVRVVAGAAEPDGVGVVELPVVRGLARLQRERPVGHGVEARFNGVGWLEVFMAWVR